MAAPTVTSEDPKLLLQLCVPEEPHRFVLEVSVQPKLVHEMWIEGEAVRQNELNKSALAQGEDTLARYLRTAEHDDLSVSGAI